MRSQARLGRDIALDNVNGAFELSALAPFVDGIPADCAISVRVVGLAMKAGEELENASGDLSSAAGRCGSSQLPALVGTIETLDRSILIDIETLDGLEFGSVTLQPGRRVSAMLTAEGAGLVANTNVTGPLEYEFEY